MQKLKAILCFLTAIFLSEIAFSQDFGIKDEIDELNSRSLENRFNDPTLARALGREALAKSKSNNYEEGYARALSRIALAFKSEKQLDSALLYFQKSLNYRFSKNLPSSGMAVMYTQIGNIYGDKNMFARSIANLEEALTIRQELGVPNRLADAYSDLAIAYKNLALSKFRAEDSLSARSDIHDAKVNFKSSFPLFKESKNFSRYANVCNMLSSVYRMEKKYDSALFYLNESEILFDSLYTNDTSSDSIDHLIGLLETYNYEGRILNESGKARKGLNFLEKALYLGERTKDTLGIFISLENIGDSYLKLKDYSEALSYFRQAEEISQRRKFDKERLNILYNNLSTAYDSLGMPAEANKYLYKRLKLNNEISLESSKARLEDATENLKLESDIAQTRIEKEYQEKLNIWIILGSIILTGLLGVILYYSYQKQKYQEIIIENQEANHMQHLLSQLEEAEQQILADQSAKQQMLLTSIGKELHDSIGSMLSAAKRELENLRNNLIEIPNKAESQFEHSYGMIDKAIRDLRKISKSPDKLSLEEQLIPSLRELCKNINRIENSPHIELNTYRLEGVKLPAKHELHIFRIIQEAITNIIKHAQATDIQLQLDWANRILSITIEDNGIGFDPEKIKHGVGLDSMRSRTEELNGTFTLDTAPGKGSTLFMEISIPG